MAERPIRSQDVFAGVTLKNFAMLKKLFSKHQGRVADKWSSYIGTYEEILSRYRDKSICLLEIGVQNGGSLEIWSEYFSNAELILGCDVNKDCENLTYRNPRVRVVVGDAKSEEVYSRVINASQAYDVILDDGSHTSRDIISCFAKYFSLLKDDGIYVVEDLHCSYWREFGGGLFYPYSSINFFKRLVDIINFEHWGVPDRRADLLHTVADEYGVSFSEEALGHIDSIQFVNSMCIIKKGPNPHNKLGTRIIVGTDAKVFPVVLGLNGTAIEDTHKADERGSEWAALARPPEVIIAEMRGAVSGLIARLEAEKRTNAEAQQERDRLLRIVESVQTAARLKEQAQRHKLQRLADKITAQRELTSHYEQLSRNILGSRSWRITSPLRRAYSATARIRSYASIILRAALPSGRTQRARILEAIRRRLNLRTTSSTPVMHSRYAEWQRSFDDLNAEDREAINDQCAAVDLPKLLVIWFNPGSQRDWLKKAADSLRRQLCSNWEAVFVTPEQLNEGEGQQINQEVAIAFVKSLGSPELARAHGRHCLLINGPGELAPHATYMFGLQAKSGVEIAFCDEDNDELGRRHSPRFAPSFSPEFQITGGVLMIKGSESVLSSLNDAHSKLGGLHTLATEAARAKGLQVEHLPFILFHSYGQSGTTTIRAAPYLKDSEALPTITIVIPTRDRRDFLEPCIESILGKTDYPIDRYEIIVVDNGSSEPEILQYLDEIGKHRGVRILRDPSKFNYSRLNNEAVLESRSDVVAFVNNDTVVIDPLWLRRLAFFAIQPDVGAVGAKLLYPDHTVQHGGVILGIQGVAGHAHLNLPADAPGYMGLSTSTHAISAVTGACLVLQRSKFDEVGGFDENLAVAFNDVLLCMALIKKGYRNIYVGHPTLVHFESKTRGLDDTEEKKRLFRREAIYARSTDQRLFKDDPYYNPNLSLETPYELAFPPRTQKPWFKFKNEATGKLRILMLSSTHQIGHGVAVVVDLQARYLAALGHTVFVGGPRGAKDFAYPGCERVFVDGPQQAAILAFQKGVDVVVMHTPPFYSTVRWLGASIKTLAYDYGEPNPEFFPDAQERKLQLQEKAFCLEMADRLFAISDAVKAESAHQRMGVIPLGNTHLATWTEAMQGRRLQKRKEWRLDGKIVVLNVCRFHEAERHYKGVDEYCSVKDVFAELHPGLRDKVIFVLAGKGTPEDVNEMESAGLRVFANLSDDELIDLYCCADIYSNYSKWEGYNLGIGQALAFGLPVVASDIPAHRAFMVQISSDTLDSAERIAQIAEHLPAQRIARLADWEEPLRMFSECIVELVH